MWKCPKCKGTKIIRETKKKNYHQIEKRIRCSECNYVISKLIKEVVVYGN